jgi:hypothetical protein
MIKSLILKEPRIKLSISYHKSITKSILGINNFRNIQTKAFLKRKLYYNSNLYRRKSLLGLSN